MLRYMGSHIARVKNPIMMLNMGFARISYSATSTLNVRVGGSSEELWFYGGRLTLCQLFKHLENKLNDYDHHHCTLYSLPRFHTLSQNNNCFHIRFNSLQPIFWTVICLLAVPQSGCHFWNRSEGKSLMRLYFGCRFYVFSFRWGGGKGWEARKVMWDCQKIGGLSKRLQHLSI